MMEESNRGLRDGLDFLESFSTELGSTFELEAPNPFLNMASHLLRHHLDGKLVTPTSLIAASGVPYATASRKLKEMERTGLLEHRERSRSGRTFSVHPSERLVSAMTNLIARSRQLASRYMGTGQDDGSAYYFQSTHQQASTIRPPLVLNRALSLSGGLRILVHGDPTFMVMDKLKRQFEQMVGVKINQRAFSIDRLREEAIRNAERPTSRYDIIAVDLPWVGEFAEKGILAPLDELMDIGRLRPDDFHPAGWRATHWGGRPYGVPSQTTPELLFYRRDLFAEAGLEPPASVEDVLKAAEVFHRPSQGRYGIAWNAARGTALGHTFIMACADFGQPVLDLTPLAHGFDADIGLRDDLRATIDTPKGLEAAEYLRAMLAFSPPDILSMSWYERIRPYAAGKVAMAYGYTALAPYFELDPGSPAYGQTGYLPHPAGPGVAPHATVGGYMLGIPANLPAERRADAIEALIAFTSAEAQKLFVVNGSRTAPRYSVGADPEVRRRSPIFEAVDAMSWREELQFWARPPIPKISEIIRICGKEFHDMLRGIQPARIALQRAQARADALLKTTSTN